MSLILNSFMYGDQKTFKQELNEALESSAILWSYFDSANDNNDDAQKKIISERILSLISSSYSDKIKDDVRLYIKFLFPNKEANELTIELVRLLDDSLIHINQIIANNIHSVEEMTKKFIEDIKTQKDVIELFELKYPTGSVQQTDIADEEIDPWELPKDIL